MARNLTLIILSWIALPALLAQHQHQWELRSASGEAVSTRKLVTVTLQELDPNALVSFHNERVKLKLRNTITPELLLQRLAQSGAGNFECVQCETKFHRNMQEVSGPPALPTNASAEEQAAHAAAKQQWAAEHPEEHQLYLDALREQNPEGHE